VTGLSHPTLPALLDAVTRLLGLAMGSFRLMRRVRMVLGLEVLGLVWGTFASIPRHGFSSTIRTGSALGGESIPAGYSLMRYFFLSASFMPPTAF
jgi:hypothetical protein